MVRARFRTRGAYAAYNGDEDAVLLLLELGCDRDDAKLREYAADKKLERVLAALSVQGSS